MNHLTPKHFELLEEALELLLVDNESQMDTLMNEGRAILKDRSYCDADTGYNLVDEYEYTSEYQESLDKEEEIKALQKLLTNLELSYANSQANSCAT